MPEPDIEIMSFTFDDSISLCSIAVSMKRIATALERLAEQPSEIVKQQRDVMTGKVR